MNFLSRSLLPAIKSTGAKKSKSLTNLRNSTIFEVADNSSNCKNIFTVNAKIFIRTVGSKPGTL
jgi:hypothetical protein